MVAAESASAATFTPDEDIIGSIDHYTVEEKDNLYAIARQHDIGIVELLSANPGIDPWAPETGTKLVITNMHILPAAPRKGIVINLSGLRLFYYADNGEVMTFPLGIGREGWETPVGETKIAKKRKDPVWISPASIREEKPDLPEIIPAGPDNPLGAYALNLGWPSYVIHGTNRPHGIGKRSSHGCIRLYPEDIEILFGVVSVGTPVTVIDMPYKLGWKGNTLFLEVTPTQEQTDVITKYERPLPQDGDNIYEDIRTFAGADILPDWYAVDRAVKEHSGVPVPIGRR